MNKTTPGTGISVWKVEGTYPSAAPFHPSEAYPEYRGPVNASEPNLVYQGVRECLRLLGYDRGHYGKPEWNPFKSIISPGNRVFIKPNLVTHEYRASSGRQGDLFSVITHPSVVRAVADYAAIALQGKGEIIIGDNPCIDADFEEMLVCTGLRQLPPVYATTFGVPCRVLDLRPRWTDNLKYYGFKSKTVLRSGDPEGSSVLNLGKHSYFYGLNSALFRGVFTKRWETIKHHHGKTQEYCISNSILNSDVFISIPKLKTHHKVGATLNIKGLVGINANKNYLVHWRIGFPCTGGDEFPNPRDFRDYLMLLMRHAMLDLLPESWFIALRERLKNTALGILFRDTQCYSFDLARGSWSGNDTCWRMAADLYNVFVKDLAGWRETRPRPMKYFSLVDGIMGGQEDGPFYPLPKESRVLVAGENLLLVDCAAARLMDFKIWEIPYLFQLLKDGSVDLKAVRVASDHWDGQGFFETDRQYLGFQPPTAWKHLALHPHQL